MLGFLYRRCQKRFDRHQDKNPNFYPHFLLIFQEERQCLQEFVSKISISQFCNDQSFLNRVCFDKSIKVVLILQF